MKHKYGCILAPDHEGWCELPNPKPPLLPDDDTAVERLAVALESAWMDPAWISGPKKAAERLIAALREGGQR